MSLIDETRLYYASTVDEILFKIARMQQVIDAQGEALERLHGLMSEARPTFQEIMEVVSEFYAVIPEVVAGKVAGKRRLHDYAHPRLVMYYLARKLTRMSLHGIGTRMSNRHHPTVLKGFQRISSMIRKNDVLRDDIDELRVRIAERVLKRELSDPKERLLQFTKVVRHDHSAGRVA